MRLLHLSDLHFDRVDPAACGAVLAFVKEVAPDLVVVTGDLTQRARARQFAKARAFLEAMPVSRLVVPGNHDVPLWNLARRFLSPLGRYRRYITQDLTPVHVAGDVAVAGLNTAHAWTVKDGAVASEDLAVVCRRLQEANPAAVKIVACHHPLTTTEVRRRRGERRGPVEVLMECGVDVFLTGHLHLSYAGHTAARYRTAGRAAIVVEAGTATSTRLRGEANGFNLLHVDRAEVTVERFQWVPAEGAFRRTTADRFTRTPTGWTQAPPE
jgi:3',5'-cyclic AMP phosphodiesterase CpdA